jgi:hypothetical protein
MHVPGKTGGPARRVLARRRTARAARAVEPEQRSVSWIRCDLGERAADRYEGRSPIHARRLFRLPEGGLTAWPYGCSVAR